MAKIYRILGKRGNTTIPYVETVGRAYWHGAKSMVSVVKHITSGKNGCLVWARQQ